MTETDGAVSVQVLQEFYFQVTRPTRADVIPHDLACDFIQTWRQFPVQETTPAILDAALEICRVHRFSFWDSAIVAAAQALGCRELYTEDLAHGRRIGDLVIVNPFR